MKIAVTGIYNQVSGFSFSDKTQIAAGGHSCRMSIENWYFGSPNLSVTFMEWHVASDHNSS